MIFVYYLHTLSEGPPLTPHHLLAPVTVNFAARKFAVGILGFIPKVLLKFGLKFATD